MNLMQVVRELEDTIALNEKRIAELEKKCHEFAQGIVTLDESWDVLSETTIADTLAEARRYLREHSLKQKEN